MLTGAFSLSAVGNNIEFFAKARVAAHEIFAIIDRKESLQNQHVNKHEKYYKIP